MHHYMTFFRSLNWDNRCIGVTGTAKGTSTGYSHFKDGSVLTWLSLLMQFYFIETSIVSKSDIVATSV